jgi:hypothetical protein
LIDADQPWMQDLIEAPGFVQNPNTHQWWLTFSAGKFAGANTNYQVDAIPCASLAGPCSEKDLVALVVSNHQGQGPGEQTPLTDANGDAWLSYNPIAPFVSGQYRPLALVRIGFGANGVPFAARPDL